MNEENRHEIIELYLLGELEPKTLKEFEVQLQEDETLQQDVVLAKEVQEALDSVVTEQLFSEKLTTLGDKYVIEPETEAEKSEPQKSNSRRTIILLTLSAIGLIVSYFIWQQSNTPNEVQTNQIFASYYQPYSSNAVTRSDDAIDEDYLNAVEAYDNGKYNEAIASLIERVAANPTEIPTQLLLGNSYLNVSPPETQKAIDIFKSLAESGSDLYATTANWYLALAYLQNNETNEAKAIFEDLSQNASGRYANLAKEILGDW